MNKIILVRHGENVANITKEFSYKTVDYSLTEKGILQAEQTAEFLKTKKIDFIYSSPLKRAYETAEIIAKTLNKSFEINENFRELNVGILEGMKPDKNTWNIFFNVIQKWLTGISSESFPEGENLDQLTKRFKNGIMDISYGKNEKIILVVGHGGIFTNGIIELSKITNKKEFYNKDNNNCSISELIVEINKSELSIEILDWANVDHLSGEATIFVRGLLDI